MGYQVEFDKQAIKDLNKLDPPVAARVIKNCSNLYRDPIRGPNISPLKLKPNIYRLRIGDYRVVYLVEGQRVVIKYVKHRREIYRDL